VKLLLPITGSLYTNPNPNYSAYANFLVYQQSILL